MNRLALATLILGALATGCGQNSPTPKPQATKPESELDRAAREMAEKLRAQGHRAQSELDNFAGQLENAVRESQAKVRNQVKQQVDKQAEALAEYAAQMAEDAKDRALDIPDVLDEFFGSGGPRREWRNRSSQRGGKSRQ
jgi:ElaB/YqjD/DUF883 family membrane-anchored ribosome-binding protein